MGLRYNIRRLLRRDFDIHDMIYFCEKVIHYKTQITSRWLDSRLVEEDIRIYYINKKTFLECIRDGTDVEERTLNIIERHLNLILRVAQGHGNQTIVDALHQIINLYREFAQRRRDVNNKTVNVIQQFNGIREHDVMTNHFFVGGPA